MTYQTEHTVVTEVSRSHAWRFWTNVENWVRLEGDSVEYIKLHGSFETGTLGTTKTRGEDPRQWKLAEVVAPERAVIEMELPRAVLRFARTLEELDGQRTRLRQHISVTGDEAEQYSSVIDEFEKHLPEGMTRLARAMESQ